MVKYLEYTAKAFTDYPIEDLDIMVDGNVVRVYDDIADYYTTCHCLSKEDIKQIMKLAEQLEQF